MGIAELLLLAVGVSMDAFAVSICKGLSMKKATVRSQLIVGGWFGGFQALMPLAGFFLGTLFAGAIEAVDHWVAFVLLGFIGVNMLKEAFEKGCDCEEIGEVLADKGIAVRAGLHCAPVAHRTAGTLESGTVRVSPSVFTSPEQIDRFCGLLRGIIRESARF